MKENNAKAAIVAYYLSKFDKLAYDNLNFGLMGYTHKKIGEILSVNHHTVKNIRDEFDPYHPNERVGWYQRPIRSGLRHISDQFSNLSEYALRGIVNDILDENSLACDVINGLIDKLTGFDNEIEDKDKDEDISVSISSFRVLTEQRAKQFFKEKWGEYYPEFSATQITDKTKDCCGYDFRLKSGDAEKMIAVKGINETSGGILLTDKEWATASEKGGDYELFIISNMDSDLGEGEVKIISDPIASLRPPRRLVQAVIQVNWILTSQDLFESTSATEQDTDPQALGVTTIQNSALSPETINHLAGATLFGGFDRAIIGCYQKGENAGSGAGEYVALYSYELLADIVTEQIFKDQLFEEGREAAEEEAMDVVSYNFYGSLGLMGARGPIIISEGDEWPYDESYEDLD